MPIVIIVLEELFLDKLFPRLRELYKIKLNLR